MGCQLPRPEVDSSPTVRTVRVTPHSGIYSVPIPPATRVSPRVSGCRLIQADNEFAICDFTERVNRRKLPKRRFLSEGEEPFLFRTVSGGRSGGLTPRKFECIGQGRSARSSKAGLIQRCQGVSAMQSMSYRILDVAAAVRKVVYL
jgi:hypothetical protein